MSNYNLNLESLLNKTTTYNSSLRYEFMFITIEDYLCTDRMECVIEEVKELEICDVNLVMIEETENYFVFKVEYEHFEDVKDVCANITHLLLQYGIFSFRLNCVGEDTYGY